MAGTGQQDLAMATVTEIADHIEATHHEFLKRELPRLGEAARAVSGAGGPLAQCAEVFRHLRSELESHLMKEEQILFPLCRTLDAATSLPSFHCVTVANPIRVMELEHRAAEDALARMRALTSDYGAPEHAEPAVRAFVAGLAALDADLREHIAKEDGLLHPRALALEEALRRQGGDG
jgi:regulator of cell morphogenesis and NO signaling